MVQFTDYSYQNMFMFVHQVGTKNAQVTMTITKMAKINYS